MPLSDPSLPQTLEGIIRHLIDLGIGSDGAGAIIVRCGKMGSVVGSRRIGIKWLPAYWSEDEEDRVIDVTGGTSSPFPAPLLGLAHPYHLGGKRVSLIWCSRQRVPRRCHCRSPRLI